MTWGSNYEDKGGDGAVIQFILGTLLGGVVGVIGMALCRAAAEADRQMGIEN